MALAKQHFIAHSTDEGLMLVKARRAATLNLIKYDPKSAVQYHYWAKAAVTQNGPVSATIASHMPERTFEGTGMLLVSCKAMLNGMSTHDQDGYSVMFKPQVSQFGHELAGFFQKELLCITFCQ
jgi:hypothetical protein